MRKKMKIKRAHKKERGKSSQKRANVMATGNEAQVRRQRQQKKQEQ